MYAKLLTLFQIPTKKHGFLIQIQSKNKGKLEQIQSNRPLELGIGDRRSSVPLDNTA